MDNVRPTVGDSSWFTHDRFGLFIHWGLYALPARHEWIKHLEQIPDDVYEKYFKFFDPDLYEPKLWAEAAAGAGMKYFVITTKHHEGFCLWDSDLTDYKVTNTPYGKDLIAPMVDAFRAQDMRAGFYHSVIDWHHPDFVIDDLHSMRSHPDRDKLNESRVQQRYADYLRGQVSELLSRYGKIDMLFYDFSYPKPEDPMRGKCRVDWDSFNLLKTTRELQPQILVNDRIDLEDVEGGWDYKTPEQFMVRDWVRVNGQPIVWETCQTFSGSWGYHRDEATWKSVEQLILLLVDSVSHGGNLLLNVGPTGRGEFDIRALDSLAGIGKWMRVNNRSIYGCTEAPKDFVCPPDCRLTYNPEKNRLYVHCFNWPLGQMHLDGYGDRVEYAQLLHDASEIRFTKQEAHQAAVENIPPDTLSLSLPVVKPNVAVPVIELFLR